MEVMMMMMMIAFREYTQIPLKTLTYPEIKKLVIKIH
jgi:hypothetical protein